MFRIFTEFAPESNDNEKAVSERLTKCLDMILSRLISFPVDTCGGGCANMDARDGPVI